MPAIAELERIVDAALDAVGDEAGWADGLARLRRSFSASAAASIARDVATGRGGWCRADGLDPGMAGAYAARWAGSNPWLAEPAACAPGRATLGEDLVPPHELVRTAFYADYLRPMGCWHRLAGTVLRTGSRVIYLALHRPPGATAFEPAERSALARLLPRLARPVSLHRQLLRRCSGSEAFRVLLDQVPHPLFLVDGALRPVAVNAAAAALAEAGGPLRVAAGRLAVERGDEDEALRRAVRTALADGEGGSGPAELVLGRDGSPRPIVLRVARLRIGGWSTGSPEDLVLVLAIDPEASRSEPATLAARLWGLGPAKAGVHRQAELLRLLERLALGSV